MWSILALGAAERLVNRVIDLDAITRIQLNQLQGQLLRVVIASPQLSVDVFFDENILRLEQTATGHSETPSLKFGLVDLALLRFRAFSGYGIASRLVAIPVLTSAARKAAVL